MAHGLYSARMEQQHPTPNSPHAPLDMLGGPQATVLKSQIEVKELPGLSLKPKTQPFPTPSQEVFLWPPK